MRKLSELHLNKTFKNDFSTLIWGLILITLYKGWKLAAFHVFIQNRNPDDTYYLTQGLNTCYRIFATVVGLFVMNRAYREFGIEKLKDNFKISALNFLILIPAFFILRSSMFQYRFYIEHFAYEFFFNFFVGTFEEITFRGLILVGLVQFFKPLYALLLSSLFFSLWHYDVINDFSSYLVIFLWGLYAGLCYERGVSLLSICIFHFIWDQIFFGFYWDIPTNMTSSYVGITEIILLFPFIALLLTNNYFTKTD